MKIHRWLDFKVTQRCNNYKKKCAYCNVPIVAADMKETMPLSIIHRTLLDARAFGFDTFWLLGGEPSIREDAEELLAPLSDDPGLTLTIVTNGKQYNTQMYHSLFSTSAQRACVQVSLDTLKPENFKRADPAHTLALINEIKQMAKQMSYPSHFCDVEVHCVISRENHENFDEFVYFFAAKKIGVSLAMVCPWFIVNEPNVFNEFTYSEAISIIKRIDQLNTGLGIDQFNPLVSQFMRQMLFEQKDIRQSQCGAGLTHLVINANGDVHRCMAESFQPHTQIGNILHERLHRILYKIDTPRICSLKADCFDGFAWDRIAIAN